MNYSEEAPSNDTGRHAEREAGQVPVHVNSERNGRYHADDRESSDVAASTSRIKVVPRDAAVRKRIRQATGLHAAMLDQSRPCNTDELRFTGEKLLGELGLSEEHLGYAMVWLGNAFWRQRFLATPFDRRLLLLPDDVEHADQCDAATGDTESEAEQCAACALEQYRQTALDLGYQVLMTSSGTAVLKTILEGQLEGIIGIANLDELERANEKVLVVRIPSYAIPLHEWEDGTQLDGITVDEVLETFEPNAACEAEAFVSLVQAANQLFADDFEQLLPRQRSTTRQAAASPLGQTEAIAYDWLQHGGKRFRPFITLAAYDALTSIENENESLDRTESPARFPTDVCRVAVAIEAFHKASLVHDDIQDDDQFRYGRETLHRIMGVGPAINIGDYLIGLGYRLVNACREELGADVAADIVNSMADAHIKLCDGQGAEMAWQNSPDWTIQIEDALEIYALKTSPAFEAALFAGLRMAGPVDAYASMIPRFAEHLGVGFQVLNDLKDWHGDADNKLVAGQDALAIRPTVLLALALDEASELQREELREIYEMCGNDQQRLSKLRELFVELGAFRRAEEIVDNAREQASEFARNVEPASLRRLLHFLVDTVLAPETSHVSNSMILEDAALSNR
ncbi:MAG: polyprenyl synthetase family protein [Planctomycetaceae bacterium]|nr:polyprenyl synthetase family protein [Planctomycetaceae bacterium]